MSATLLFITHGAIEHVSAHDNDDAAFAALVRYVDDHWADAQLPKDAAYPDPDTRIEAWFAATRALYFIGDTSIEFGPE